jgi:hypothetical protein
MPASLDSSFKQRQRQQQQQQHLPLPGLQASTHVRVVNDGGRTRDCCASTSGHFSGSRTPMPLMTTLLIAVAVVTVQCGSQIADGATLPLDAVHVLADADDGVDVRRQQQRLEAIIDRLLQEKSDMDHHGGLVERPASDLLRATEQLEALLARRLQHEQHEQQLKLLPGDRNRRLGTAAAVSASPWNRPRTSRMTSKRGPGLCINSCLTGGMTFVRCKSMCH